MSSEHIGTDMLARMKPHVLAELQAMLSDAKGRLGRRQSDESDVGASSARVPRQQCVTELGREFMRSAWSKIKCEDVLVHDMVCLVHEGCRCRSYPTAAERLGRLLMVIAGSTCCPWSAMGSRFGWLDVASLVFLVFLREIQEHLPEVVLHECTPSFDHATFAELLQDDYTCQFVVTNPLLQGHPSGRPRKYCILTLKTAQRITPWNTDEYMRVGSDDFKACVSMYFSAPSAIMHAHRRKLAKRRHTSAEVNQLPTPWPCLLSCSLGRSYTGYYKLGKKLAAKKDSYKYCVADLRQAPGYFGVYRNRLPALTRNTVLFAWAQRKDKMSASARLMHPACHIQAHGLPIFFPQHQQYRHLPLKLQGCDSLNDTSLRLLSGNGMNAAQVGIALVFAICGTAF